MGLIDAILSLKKQIILVSQNFKLAFKITEATKELYEITHMTMEDPGVNMEELIFTSFEEKKQFTDSKFIGLSANWSNITILSYIIHAIERKKESKCIIGIDPGLSIGTSIILNGNLLDTCVFYSVRNVLNWINSKIKLVEADEYYVKIGNGGGRYHLTIVNYLEKNLPNKIQLEIIDEKKTSIKENAEMTIHEQAAIKIAKRKGIKINRS